MYDNNNSGHDFGKGQRNFMLRKDLSTLSVKRIIFLYNKKVDFKKKFIALTKQTAKIERELTNLDELVDFLDGISEIYYDTAEEAKRAIKKVINSKMKSIVGQLKMLAVNVE